MRYVLTIPAPAAWIRSNQHKDAWRTRATLTRAWRDASAWHSRRLPVFGAGPVRVTATFHRDDNRTYDLDGMAVTVKAAIDGLRDSGRITDDHCRVIPELVLRAGEPWADASLVITIEPIQQEATA